MANIDTYLYIIKEAEKGSDMRNAIHDALLTLSRSFELTTAGAPLPVSEASEMTDTTKLYLYVGSESGYTNGDWYYYDGSAFVSGGTYANMFTVEDDGNGNVHFYGYGPMFNVDDDNDGNVVIHTGGQT